MYLQSKKSGFIRTLQDVSHTDRPAPRCQKWNAKAVSRSPFVAFHRRAVIFAPHFGHVSRPRSGPALSGREKCSRQAVQKHS